MNIHISTLRGNSVFSLLDDENFVYQWKQLAHDDEKATIIQEPAFVITWYKQYVDKYEPVLILGYDSQDSLVGLMPLAFHLKNKCISHAGDYQAEYHGWICRKSIDADFLLQAFIAIRKKFNLKTWKWRSIPPGSEVSWLDSDIFRKQKIYIKYYSVNSALLDLYDEGKLNNLKRYRSNQVNRYKRRGEFYLERIKSKEKARLVFDELAKQCDFRQMAAYESMPFANDRNKKDFFIERLNYPEKNHFTILWSNGSIVAYHFGSCDSNTVYLGLMGYNPIEEKNSPGSVLIVKLAELLREEGYHYLDLTIGGDYKEKYCNLHQKLSIPTIYFSRKEKIIADCKGFAWDTLKYLISKTGGQPKAFSNKMKRFKGSIKNLLSLNLSDLFNKLSSFIYNKEVFILYKLNVDGHRATDPDHSGMVHINKYPDLLLSAELRSECKKELLKNALRHFCQEDMLYTVVLEGVLAQYGWMTRGGACQKSPDEIMQFNTPVNSFILYDFLTEKKYNKEELFPRVLEKMIKECRLKGAAEAYIPVRAIDSSERNLIEKYGFKIDHKRSKTKTLGFMKSETTDLHGLPYYS